MKPAEMKSALDDQAVAYRDRAEKAEAERDELRANRERVIEIGEMTVSNEERNQLWADVMDERDDLRAQVKHWENKEALAGHQCWEVEKERDELKAENERLRGRLPPYGSAVY